MGPGESIGAVTQIRYCGALFNRVIPFILFLGDYVPTRFLPFAGDVAEPRALDRRASSDARRCDGRRIHLISTTSTCSIGGVSECDERLTSRHVAFREARGRHQIEGLKINR